MSDKITTEADHRLEEALEREGARDPREFYRARLRELKGTDPEGYEKAVAYYRETLLPEIAAGDAEPLTAWTEYGRRLAAAVAPGRTVCVDGSGRAFPYESPPSLDRLILHLPDEKGSRALLVGLPPVLTPAQRATYDVLIQGRQKPTES
jgi:hypothetical protein